MAIVIGAGIAATGAVAGSAISANAAGNAADAQTAAANSSIGEQQREFNQTRADQAGFRTTGNSGLNDIAKLYGLDHIDANGNAIKGSGKSDFSSFSASPDFQFAQQQGQLGLNRSLAAQGGALSGAAVKESERFNSGLASQNFNTYYNHLAGIAGIGQTATNFTDAVGQTTANQVGNAYQNAGNARASAYLDQGQTFGNLTNGLANSYLQYQNRANPGYTNPAYGTGQYSSPYSTSEFGDSLLSNPYGNINFGGP